MRHETALSTGRVVLKIDNKPDGAQLGLTPVAGGTSVVWRPSLHSSTVQT